MRVLHDSALQWAVLLGRPDPDDASASLEDLEERDSARDLLRLSGPVPTAAEIPRKVNEPIHGGWKLRERRGAERPEGGPNAGDGVRYGSTYEGPDLAPVVDESPA